MLDLIGTTVLIAAIAVNLNAAITTMPLSSEQKLTTVAIAGLWIGLAIALATTGIYAATATPVPVVGVMAGSPLIVVGVAALLFARVREALLALPVALLVGLNTMRILPGAFMVLLALQGRLSGPFPQSAGWGDVIVGLTAIPLTVATARNLWGNRRAVLAWNIFGTLDLVTAVCARRRVGAGIADPDFRRNHRLHRDVVAAMVEHPDLAGAVLSDHPRHHLRQAGMGQAGGYSLGGSACRWCGCPGNLRRPSVNSGDICSRAFLWPKRNHGSMGHLTEMGDHRVGSGSSSRLSRNAAATE